MKLGTNFAIFILFFGVAALDALQTQNWLRVGVFATLGILCLWADARKGHP
ncbi:MAG: hypothetical protein WC798_00070 [Candidatus Paceibacterota bacterium]|jgi:hypothetical protein